MRRYLVLLGAVLTLAACAIPPAPPPSPPEPTPIYNLALEGLAGLLAQTACAAEPLDTREHFAKYVDELVALGDRWELLKVALETSPNNSAWTVLWNVINYTLGTAATAEVWNSGYPRVALAVVRGCKAGLHQPMGVD